MSDFMKLFRRQKSVKQVLQEKTDKKSSEDYVKNDDNTNDADTSQLQDMSISTEFYNHETSRMSIASCDPSEVNFKEPKGWRKSLRKLKWKKRETSMSISSDNLVNMPNNASSIVIRQKNLESPSKPSKRWSYSADLCEENVPGARELRGTLERKLSVKHEVDEREHYETPRRKISQKLKWVTAERRDSQSSNDEYVDCLNQKSEPTFSTFLQQPDSENQKENDPPATSQQHFINQRRESLPIVTNPSDAEQDSNLSTNEGYLHGRAHSVDVPIQHQPVLDRGEWPPGDYHEPMDITVTEDDVTQTTSASAYSLPSIEPSTSGQSICVESASSDDDNEGYDLDDINEALTSSRGSTLRGKQTYDDVDQDTNTIHNITSSLMRGRAITKFERDAEFVLENLEYNNYDIAPVDHYYKQLNDQNGNRNFSRVDTSDDNISWGSHEFDSSSEESDEEIKQSKEEGKGKKRGKVKDSSKEATKLRFWERTSLKKKTSSSKAPEPEPSSFVDIQIPADRNIQPQLPALMPAELTDNQQKRRRIVGTIISSEQSYIESLQRLETDYKRALLHSKPPIISNDAVEKIFYKISDILQCHRLFQMALASAATNWDLQESIGGTFVASFSKSMVLECYGEFINNFTAAMDTVRKTCIRKPNFLGFLRERQNESKDRLNLYGLMLKPVQRFPQFIMLVQDLLKHTPSEHVDKLQLQLALTELETLADRLNQRKAYDEDASDFRSLLENSNVKLSAQTKDGRTRRLIKQGDVRECEYNENGLLEKVKDCLLVLINDMLICCSISNRKPHQRSNTSTYKDMYKLKWRVGLDVVQVSDGSSRNNKQVERETLHSDFVTLHQINRLIERLQLRHEGVSTQMIDKCITDLQIRIRQAEQVASQPEDASFTVKFRGKSDTRVTRTLILPYNSLKDEWLESISRAKLANAPANLDSWFGSDGSDYEALWEPPLFLRSVSAHTSYETLQVQCAYSFMPTGHVTLLWLSCAASTVLALVSVYYITEERVEKVHVMQVESSVQCMEHWNPFDSGYSVWLGMESGCLLEYSADGSYKKLSEVAMPTMSTVMIMKAHMNKLYVGQLDGTLTMFERPADSIDLLHLSSIVVGTGPLVCLSPVAGKLWGCSGNNVVTINMDGFHTESSRSLVMDGERLVVNLVTRVGSGLWVTFSNECNLNLYHLESLMRLQEINLSRVIRDFVQSLDVSERISEQCHITSMCSGHSHLFVGTSNGLLLSMPLPKLPGSVPKITGPCKICRHTILNPLTFLFAPELPRVGTRDNTPPLVDDEDLPPPLPRRDDLDQTVVPLNQEEADEERSVTLTDSRINDQSPSSSTHLSATHREAPPPPYMRFDDASPLSPRTATPPPRPPMLDGGEETPRKFSYDQWLENGCVYENKESLSIESPRKLTFVSWNEKSCRQFPVVLACGEGYRRFSSKPTRQLSTSQSENTNSPTILCWRVITS